MTYLSTLTFIHTTICLIALGVGAIVLCGILHGRYQRGWTATFIALTLAICVTGFMFPFHQILPSHIFGVMTVLAMAGAIYALYSKRLSGFWRGVYVACAVFAFYLNAFVAIVQAFLKIPALQPLAPTQSEPPFLVAQVVLLILAVVAGIIGTRRFRAAAI